MNNRVVSYLGFEQQVGELFGFSFYLLYSRLGAEASGSLEMPTGADKKEIKQNATKDLSLQPDDQERYNLTRQEKCQDNKCSILTKHPEKLVATVTGPLHNYSVSEGDAGARTDPGPAVTRRPPLGFYRGQVGHLPPSGSNEGAPWPESYQRK